MGYDKPKHVARSFNEKENVLVVLDILLSLL
jgi:hypothetical protein